jgi:hypothetical protein
MLKFATTIGGALALTAVPAAAQDDPPLIDAQSAAAIAAEVSGSAAKRTVQALSQHHRMRGSRGYDAAADLIRERLAEFGLKQIETIELAADGKIFYGTQRSRPAWNASFAELWKQRQSNGRWVDSQRIASWADQPISLAQDSVRGAADAELVNVGAGSSESDYAGKNVRGKLVLISAQPEAAAALAVTKYGAAGIVSWAQNQKQAWWGEDQSLIRWGHLDTWKDPAFAFMVSPERARAWQEQLGRGEAVRLRAKVEAGRTAGYYRIPSAAIPGRDPAREIVYSCHLDHPSPGANDNASGCAGILEVTRTLNRLIADGRLPQPLRTIRFIWPCEVECTISLLNARPEFAARTLATLHLDMIGGDTEKTKSNLQVEGSPPSLPSFVDDVGFAIARWVNAQTMEFAENGASEWPLLDSGGEKRPLQAEVGGFSGGSDHVVWTEGSWRIPVIYIADWPDRYIHTQRDIPANLDATKMKRAIFIAAAAGWYLANVEQKHVPQLEAARHAESLDHQASMSRRIATMSADDAALVAKRQAWGERAEAASFARFGLRPSTSLREPGMLLGEPAAGAIIYRRKARPKGPMDGFGYSWFDDHLERAGLPRPALLDRTARRDGGDFAYEALNLVDGGRSLEEIRAQLSATSGPVPIVEVAEYLSTLEKLGLLERR